MHHFTRTARPLFLVLSSSHGARSVTREQRRHAGQRGYRWPAWYRMCCA